MPKSLEEIARIVDHYSVGLDEEDLQFLHSEIDRFRALEHENESLRAIVGALTGEDGQ